MLSLEDPEVKSYYHYLFKKTELGIEVYNTRNHNQYFVTETEQNGLSCNCKGVIIGNSKECVHRRHVKKLFKD